MPLILASGSLQFLVSAASIDKEVEPISKKGNDARTFRDEIEHANSARYKTKTLEECYKGNFKDCYSVFPNHQCLHADECVMLTCRDSVSCNGECVH